ncbi:alpha/beta fold hydrolase [Sulfitobacter pseudonitzschiae]|nr:alpha/beta fold hydrolase [Pseudosulfitobacter pseudonitzschiae]
MLLSVLKFAAISAVTSLAIAIGLIVTQRPGPAKSSDDSSLDFTETLARGLEDVPATTPVQMRDGYALQIRRYGAAGPEDVPLVVLIHGSGWHGMQFHTLASALASEADVVVPDLRGHGAAPGRRGDVDYIGQYEDDLADLITDQARTGQKVVMVGHFSGGGLVVRMAGGAHGAMIDRAVLLAPFLKHNAATTRRNSGGWARVLVRRVIGLSMLNAVGVRALNHLTIIQFDMPRAVLDGPLGRTATTAYSYRLNSSFAPRSDFLGDVAALPPFALVVGAQDEAFVADAYAPLMRSVTEVGQYHIVPNVGHLDIVDAPQTLAVIQEAIDAVRQ